MASRVMKFFGVRPIRAWRLATVGALAAVIAFTSYQEHQHPWCFYDWVGSRVPITNDIFGDYGIRVEARQRTAPLAREAARVDGVARVDWPLVLIHKPSGGLLDRPFVAISAYLESGANLGHVGQLLKEICLSGPSDLSIEFRLYNENGFLACSSASGSSTCGVP